MKRVLASLVSCMLYTGLAIAADAEISFSVAKTTPQADTALYYDSRPGKTFTVPMSRVDGSTYSYSIFLNGPAERVAYKLKPLGYPVYDKKNANGAYTRYRDTKVMMYLREDGYVVWQSTP